MSSTFTMFGLVSFIVAGWLLWIGYRFSQQFPAHTRQHVARTIGGVILIGAIFGMLFGTTSGLP